MHRRTIGWSATSPTTSSTVDGISSRLPVDKLSKTRTARPSLINESTRWDPINPHPPVTRYFGRRRVLILFLPRISTRRSLPVWMHFLRSTKCVRTPYPEVRVEVLRVHARTTTFTMKHYYFFLVLSFLFFYFIRMRGDRDRHGCSRVTGRTSSCIRCPRLRR
jgi:hypothetical protein